MNRWAGASRLRRLGQVAAAVMLAGSLAACGGGSSRQSGGNVIRVWTFLSSEGTSPREVVLNELIAEFESAHKGVDVRVEAQPFEELEAKFMTASQRGDAPDVIWARDSFLHLLDEAGVLADLNKHLSKEFTGQALPDLFEVFAQKAVFDGRRVALPIWPTPAQVLFYRQDVLKAAGLDAPPLGWSAFSAAVKELTKDSRFGLGLPANDTGVTPFLMLLNGFKEEAFDKETGRFDLLGPQSVRVAETIRALATSGAVAGDTITATGQDIQDQFASGRYAIAMAFGPRYSAYVDSAAGYDPATLKVGAWPSFDSESPSALLGPYWNIGLSAKSDNLDTAAAFVEHLYSKEASLAWAKKAGQVPDRRSVLKDPFFSTDKGEVITDFVKIIEADGARVLPQRIEDVTKLANVLNGAVQRLIGTKDDVKTILKDAQSELGWGK
ncbi:extracellular solute-binding protein [Streptosporangium sp. NPDC001681]|uniref:ABC transporter substrate-binding protein n=1 Tax=Streptosporangium sp. NPDC001681 TaxID=3154395 RepID=UPI00332A991E